MKSKSKIKFSIVVPIYKVEDFLKICIDSILQQTYSNLELILVDDGSPDSCPKICDDYAKRDNRVKVIHKKNGGLVSARNAGILAATGDYICYVDGDDWVEKNTLEEIYNKGIKNHNSDIIIFNLTKKFIDHNVDNPFYVEEGFYDKERLNKDIYPYMMFDNRKKFCTGLVFPTGAGKAYKKELLLNHYCKDERIRMGEDNAFSFECLYFASSAFFINKPLYVYNQLNVNSITSNYDLRRFDNNKYLFEYMESNLGGIDDILDYELNGFKAYWLIMAIFHEVKTKQKFFKSIKHIKNKIKETNVLNKIYLKDLPFSAQVYIFLLKMNMFSLVWILSWFVEKFRG